MLKHKIKKLYILIGSRLKNHATAQQRNMIVYLTFNDYPSGIYSSQVIDVVKFLGTELNQRIRLITFVSIRNFFSVKKKIKQEYSNAIVLPLFPKLRFWKLNSITLFFAALFLRPDVIWARGPFATNLALMLKKTGLVKKVIFDARGAYQAELTEYDVVNDKSIIAAIEHIECKVLNESDAQLAVSVKLQEWWKTKYNFIPIKSAVIPCTLSSYFQADFPKEESMREVRKQNGYNEKDVVLIYSGSSAGWQSFDLVHDYLLKLFSSNEKYKLIFMSDSIPLHLELFKKFRNRITTRWMKPHEVRNVLLCGDYGLLIREASITNYVSSPVKFSEYLSCGLKILISDGIGDYPVFVSNYNCGVVLDPINDYPLNLTRVLFNEKVSLHQTAMQHFTKSSYLEEYKNIIE